MPKKEKDPLAERVVLYRALMSGSLAQSRDPCSAVRKRFERFARQEGGSLYTLFRRCLGNAESARDLLQDTLLEAWKNLARYDSSRPFGAWIFRIGHNRMRNYLRRQRLENRTIVPLAWEPLSEVPAPAQHALERERQEQLERALVQLPLRQRLAVLLRYQEQLSCREIGDILEMTPNAVSIQLHQARRTLKKCLGKNYVGGG